MYLKGDGFNCIDKKIVVHSVVHNSLHMIVL